MLRFLLIVAVVIAGIVAAVKFSGGDMIDLKDDLVVTSGAAVEESAQDVEMTPEPMADSMVEPVIEATLPEELKVEVEAGTSMPADILDGEVSVAAGEAAQAGDTVETVKDAANQGAQVIEEQAESLADQVGQKVEEATEAADTVLDATGSSSDEVALEDPIEGAELMAPETPTNDPDSE